MRSFQFRDALRVGNIFLSNEFFSVLLDEREALKQMRDELCRFAIVTEPAKTTFGKGVYLTLATGQPKGRGPTMAFQRSLLNDLLSFAVRKTYTGKIGGLNDDLAITLQLAITGLRCFYQSDKYNNFRPDVY